jgi:hypothetical protein
MRQALKKIRPASGFSHTVHLIFTLLLPMLVYIFVRINLVPLAVGIVLLSKWRVLAVRPRHWLAYLRANAVDLVVGLSMVVFMSQTTSMVWQLVWLAVYTGWLLIVKPSASVFGIAMQALMAQTSGLMALYLVWGDSPLAVLVIGTWAVAYVSARHFFTGFDEPYTRFLSDCWGYFGGALAWILGHWLLYYGRVSQPTLFLSVLGVGLGTLYYLQKNERLSQLLRRQIVFIMAAIIVVILVCSEWGGKTI